ncbi:hypothetical protein SCLCIDRAFT_279184 [Scleroderma citrinum Foug A]|uniref:Uncharacterized protein n=1 Tax=Scleroderma citrinum Foug A TaxID=1036808 RepID=A0A0C2ZTU4_9AGAM|nr:hypothetical protein SCLCIDRAFT_279184 [Scleroderma citrinum Foug A]
MTPLVFSLCEPKSFSMISKWQGWSCGCSSEKSRRCLLPMILFKNASTITKMYPLSISIKIKTATPSPNIQNSLRSCQFCYFQRTVSTNSPEDEDGNPVDQFETLNNKSENRDHQVNCEIHEGGHRCGRLISFNSLKSHMAEFHDIPKEDKVLCPWASCQHLSYRKNLERHIKTKHLGFKRLLVPQS